MGLKIFTIDFSELSKRSSIRGDFRFANYFQKDIPYKYTYFKDFIIKISNGKDIATDNYVSLDVSEVIYPTVNNIKSTGLVLDEVTAIDDDYSGGYYIEDFDIALTRSGTVGITKCWDKKEINATIGKEVESIPSGYLIIVKPDQEKVNPKFAEHYFNSSLLKEYFLVFGVGKSQRNIAQGDIKYIPFPLISKTKQDRIVAQIEPIERSIKTIKALVKPHQKVVNEVFAKEFGFNLKKFEELKQIKNYYLDLFTFGNNRDIRQSVKFHREAGKFVVQQLNKVTSKKIKDFISEPITLGKGVSPNDYDENGDFFYISMANIKNWQFDSAESKLVSKEYSNNNKNKTVSKDDILIARSGEGTIGKVALIDDEDLQGIFADFTMRIRLQNYNPLFAYYYFRTEYFQYLIEVNKKGLGNNTNIFPSQIQEFPMIDIPLKAQQKIVDEIKAELDKQAEIKSKIESERNKIDIIIEKSIN
jgi:type I restriction enzyme S subunit